MASSVVVPNRQTLAIDPQGSGQFETVWQRYFEDLTNHVNSNTLAIESIPPPTVGSGSVIETFEDVIADPSGLSSVYEAQRSGRVAEILLSITNGTEFASVKIMAAVDQFGDVRYSRNGQNLAQFIDFSFHITHSGDSFTLFLQNNTVDELTINGSILTV